MIKAIHQMELPKHAVKQITKFEHFKYGSK